MQSPNLQIRKSPHLLFSHAQTKSKFDYYSFPTNLNMSQQRITLVFPCISRKKTSPDAKCQMPSPRAAVQNSSLDLSRSGPSIGTDDSSQSLDPIQEEVRRPSNVAEWVRPTRLGSMGRCMARALNCLATESVCCMPVCPR
jgi:hypothetical protein